MAAIALGEKISQTLSEKYGYGRGAQWVMKRGTCALRTMKTYEDTKTTFYRFNVASPQSYSQNCKVLYTHFSLCESIFFSVSQLKEEKYFILFCYWLTLQGTLPMSLYVTSMRLRTDSGVH